MAVDNSIHHLRATGTVFRNEKGDPLRMVGLNWDVTKDQEAAKAIEEYSKLLEMKNQELNEFTYIASHDLQEPINTMNALATYFLSSMMNNWMIPRKNTCLSLKVLE